MQLAKLNEEIDCVKQTLQSATSENLIERCQKYLGWLNNYRAELYKFRGTAEINRDQKLSAARLTIDELRKEIRAAIEIITRERNETEDLLKSLTMLSGSEALEVLNKFRYKGFADWELKAGGFKFGSGTEIDKISVQEAVLAASLLRREEFLSRKTTFESDKL